VFEKSTQRETILWRINILFLSILVEYIMVASELMSLLVCDYIDSWEEMASRTTLSKVTRKRNRRKTNRFRSIRKHGGS